jgi:hypothetical protein
MLRILDDPAAIGPGMAVALLTTFYGAVLAFLVFGPIAEKLAARSGEEVHQKQLAIASVDSILRGDNSLVIQSKLEAYLSPQERDRGWSRRATIPTSISRASSSPSSSAGDPRSLPLLGPRAAACPARTAGRLAGGGAGLAATEVAEGVAWRGQGLDLRAGRSRWLDPAALT